MKNKTLISQFFLSTLISLYAFNLYASENFNIKQIREFHDSILTIDTHIDIPTNFATSEYDPMVRSKPTQKFHLHTMAEGGLDAVFLVVYAQQRKRELVNYSKSISESFLRFHAIHKLTKKLHPDKIGLALSSNDIIRLNNENKKIALIGIENGFPIGKNLTLLETFYDYGARYFGFLHDGHNDLGDSARPQERLNDPKEEHKGLSELGEKAVKKLNQLGIILDISHSSEQTSIDILNLSRTPVIASHSGVDGILDHPRNMSDKELFALKENNGVIQIVAFGSYLSEPTETRVRAINNLKKSLGYKDSENVSNFTQKDIKAFYQELENINNRFPSASVSDLVNHIDYVVKTIGINHVGISSDFNGGGGIKGWNDPSETPNITIELFKRGYSKNEIIKIWGGNFLRVFRDVEKYSEKWKKTNEG